MSRIVLDVPEETLRALKLTPEKFAEELRVAAAMKLFELGRLSSGAAAAVAGIPKPLFLSKLAEYGIDAFALKREEMGRESLVG